MIRVSFALSALWVVGLVTAVPWGVYYILFRAPREHYVPVFGFLIGWVFFYWPIVGPLLMAWQVRRLMRALEATSSAAEREAILKTGETEDIAVEVIARDNGIPRWLARRVYRAVLERLAARRRAQAKEA